ncbi:MAG: glycoside hydrolase family 88 protein [Bacteroidaceae bacterium]|nr:glycoside hydrolase family 88 protein [Bacteroidaceae bacterium]
MKVKTLSMMGAIVLLSITGEVYAQKKEKEINDSNTPLHLLKPDYQTPYGAPTVEQVKATMDRVLNYLEGCTPTRVVNKNNGKTITDYAHMGPEAQVERGTFRLTSYEWGVTYSAMLAATEATGDPAYSNYAINRFKFLNEVAPHFKKLIEKHGKEIDPLMRQMLTPKALDDAGAVCAAMIKAQQKDPTLNLNQLIENYIDFIVNKEYRLADGTFARTRPFYNTLWLDDMFMGIPPIAQYATIAGEKQAHYLAEAVRQILQFKERMWVPEKNLFRHGWVEEMQDHPAFHWARANGWALLTLCEVLDVLPDNYPQRDKLMELYRNHVRGLAALQSGEGLWHQLLDRPDSYLETSATAIYAYCIAHGINKGWIDAMAYGPVATLAWNAVTTQINEKGQVGGTCVGTGMAFDPAFYCYRPVTVYAAHGYGPVIWAGAEIINLLKNQHPKMNDSATLFYQTEQTTNQPIFHEKR